LQKNGKRTRNFYMPCFGLLPARSLVDQENIGINFESKTDRFAFSRSKFRSQASVDLLYLPLLNPYGRRGRPGTHLGGSLRVLHLDQDGVGNQNTAIDFLKNVRMA
jgi:hypothetical protein